MNESALARDGSRGGDGTPETVAKNEVGKADCSDTRAITLCNQRFSLVYSTHGQVVERAFVREYRVGCVISTPQSSTKQHKI